MGSFKQLVFRSWGMLAAIVWLALLIPLGVGAFGIERDPFLFVVWLVAGSNALYGLTIMLKRATNVALPGTKIAGV